MGTNNKNANYTGTGSQCSKITLTIHKNRTLHTIKIIFLSMNPNLNQMRECSHLPQCCISYHGTNTVMQYWWWSDTHHWYCNTQKSIAIHKSLSACSHLLLWFIGSLDMCIVICIVMCSMKTDLKSANVNFEIVKYVVDDCLTNIKKKKKKKKSRSKSAQLTDLGYFEICCEKTAFWEKRFWNLWTWFLGFWGKN